MARVQNIVVLVGKAPTELDKVSQFAYHVAFSKRVKAEIVSILVKLSN